MEPRYNLLPKYTDLFGGALDPELGKGLTISEITDVINACTEFRYVIRIDHVHDNVYWQFEREDGSLGEFELIAEGDYNEEI
jgi:hypothetical protein